MDNFWIYFQLGIQHITDLQGADHMLFVIALSSTFKLSEWRKLLVLITAFTIGHSLSLALSTFNYVIINIYWIELLIPSTILLTALFNIWLFDKYNIKRTYWLPAIFGVIHGLGFSNYLKALLGFNENIMSSLLAFNLGLEIGQIFIILIFSICLAFVYKTIKVDKRIVIRAINFIIALLSLGFIYKSV